MKRIFSILAFVVVFAAVARAQDEYDDYYYSEESEDEYGYFESEDYEETYGYETEEGSSQGLHYKNEATGYLAYVMDEAELLTDSQEKTLLENMTSITNWGNAIFCTSKTAAGSSEQDLAASIYEGMFGHKVSGVIFLVDMSRRKLVIHTDGDIEKTVTADYADTITDNIYRMASDGDYYACASEAFSQIQTLLAGGKIRQPMKHTSNALLALTLALFICYLYMKGRSKTASEKAQPKADPVFKGEISNIDIIPGKLTSRVIQSSSSGRSGFSGGGGGGHSGSSGGHSF